MHSETSSVALEIAPVPVTIRTSASTDPTNTIRVLQITQLAVEDVSSVVWQGHNNLYCTLALSHWEHRTPTKPEAGATANWEEIFIDLPIAKSGGLTDRKDAMTSLLISVSHENLVVTDKVIGQAEVLLNSIFGAEVSSDTYTCSEPIDVVQTVYEGTKVKRKMKGLVKFQARIVHVAFDPARNATKLINLPSQREKMEFKLDSATGSIATQSVDPYAMREDSGSVYDFSSVQLRNAADILQKLEAPTNNVRTMEPAKPTSASSSRGEVGATAAPSKSASKQSTAQSQSRTDMPPLAVPPAAAYVPEVPSLSNQLRRPSKPQSGVEQGTTSNKQGSVEIKSTAKLSSTTSTARAKTPTRLRTRRAGEEEPAADVQPSSVATIKPRKSSVGKLLAAGATSANLSRTAPARVSDLAKTEAGKSDNRTSSLSSSTQPVSRSLGYQVIDEAFRLAMKKKGAYLRLTMSELASLLSTLGFVVRADLQPTAAKLSLLCTDQGKLGVAPAEDSHVSLPIVHAMSLAATISFLVRDHNLLRNPGGGDGSSQSLGTMSELQADIALKQLISLVEGAYNEVKKFIVGVCDGVSSGSKASATADVSKCRPSTWSAQTTQAFLQALNVHVPPSASAVTAEELLEMDQTAAFRARFGGNTSIDLTRMAVYTQALRFIDSWWDRGIRPGDNYDRDSSHLAEDKTFKTGGSKKGKSKRRGSKQSSTKFSGDWGDLSSVQDPLQDDNSTVQGSSRVGGKMVEGGRVIQSHLLKIADFQPLLESITPLNRAFGWGCSLEALVRFASIVGGMRGHLWVPAFDSYRSTHNSSFEDLSCLENTSSTGNVVIPSNQDEIGRWVVLQKCSAHSASELTQLVRLCNDLSVVMKYASREDDFLAFIPTSCLRITSVQEVRATNFKADLEGLLLDDICVGKKVVVTDLSALTRTCERFDWWDRPSPAVLEGMCNQTGEVVSLAELQEKRRVGVKLFNSGVCDALPLEALRLCTDEELAMLLQKEEENKEDSSKPSQLMQAISLDEEQLPTKTTTGRRKSKAGHGETSRKTKLRTLIKNLNIIKSDEAPSPLLQPPKSKTKASTQPSVPESTFEELSHKSELSNLSGEAELEKLEILRSSPTKKKKTVSGPPSPLYSPQKRIVRRTMVRNTPQPPSPSAGVVAANTQIDSFDALNFAPPAIGDCDAPPEDQPKVETKRPAAASGSASKVSARTSGRSSPVIHVTTSLRASPELSKEDSLVTRLSAVEPTIDYSWLKGPARSPLKFDDDEVVAAGNHDIDLVVPVTEHVAVTDKKAPHGPAPLHIFQASFDAERAEYTEGVMRARANSATGTRAKSHAAASRDEAEEPEIINNQFRSKFVRTNRPQSAPSAKNKNKRAAPVAAGADDPERTEPVDKNSSFGLAGVGYVGGGKLQPHANLWVNEDIPAIPEAEVPRVIPNKQLVHSKDYKTQTEKLFEYHERTVALSPQRNSQKITSDKKGDHFGDIMLAAANDGHSSPEGGRKTVKIPARPRSANPVSRGVSSNKSTGLDGTADAGTNLMGTAHIAGPAGAEETTAAGKTGTTRPKSASGSGRPKRTREEELRHIAESRATRELSLKEKVLQKELKRIEVHGSL